MAQEIEDVWHKLKQTDEEEDGVTVEDISDLEEFVVRKLNLVGKLLAEKQYNREVFITSYEQVVEAKKDAMFRNIRRDLFLIQFQDEIERDNVMLKGLWNFNNALFLLREIQGSEKPSNIEQKEAMFWVQVYDLLLMPMREGVARRIGSAVIRGVKGWGRLY